MLVGQIRANSAEKIYCCRAHTAPGRWNHQWELSLHHQRPPFILFSLSSDWPAKVWGQQCARFLSLQSLMTDLKDGSLSPLLQITSSDMFGHTDNVLSENSFQRWMGYKLSTPRVGYFFNWCFILPKRERERTGGKRAKDSTSNARIKDCTKQ